MSLLRTWQYRVSRATGKAITHLVAALTLYRMPPFVATSALVVRGTEVLVVIDPIRNEPILPGGHLRWKESPEEALTREVREETGYEVWPAEVVGVFSGIRSTGDPGVVRVVYEAAVVGGELASSPEGEATWIDAESLSRGETRDAPIVRLWLSSKRRTASGA